MNLRKVLFTCFIVFFSSSNMLWKISAKHLVAPWYQSTKTSCYMTPDKWIPVVKCGKYAVVCAVIVVKNLECVL